jgi:hypothetical protein
LKIENTKLEKPEVIPPTITSTAPTRRKKVAVKLNAISEDQQQDEVSNEIIAPAPVEKKAKKRRESVRLDSLQDENSNPSI